MHADEVPPGYAPVTCRRCGDVLAMHRDTSDWDRKMICAEHHLWLCTNPTAVATRVRHQATLGRFPDPPQPP